MDGPTLDAEKFESIDLADPFFDSLKSDYSDFEHWFRRKGDSVAFVFRTPGRSALDGFLYLKEERGPVTDVKPPLPEAARLKIGTFKINPHETRLGERFIKRAFDTAIEKRVTAF